MDIEIIKTTSFEINGRKFSTYDDAEVYRIGLIIEIISRLPYDTRDSLYSLRKIRDNFKAHGNACGVE